MSSDPSPRDPDGTSGEGGGGLSMTDLPSWIWSPRSFIFKRISEFVIVAVLTFVSGVGEAIVDAALTVRGWFVNAGGAVGGSFAFVGGGALELVLWVRGLVAAINQAAGPLAFVVWGLIIAVTIVVLWRLGKVLITAIPFVGPELRELFLGAYLIGALGLLTAALELVGVVGYA